MNFNSQNLSKDLSWKLPSWLESELTAYENHIFTSDKEKMDFVLMLTAKNIKNKTGGPFGAACFCMKTQTLISVGVNQVALLHNPCLHAETTALQLACKKASSYSLKNFSEVELFSSCEPCMMCFGACLWSGIKRLVTSATAQDAKDLGFDEGPVGSTSWDYLKQKGVEIKKSFLRQKGRDLLKIYQKDGLIYNA